MKYLEKHPMLMIVAGILGISMSSIFVKYSTAPSAVTAAFRLLWTVVLMSPVVWGKKKVRTELVQITKKDFGLSVLSGIFLAIHFVVWFESLQHTSVASSTTIVCTEVIWVALGFCLFLKEKLSKKAVLVVTCMVQGYELFSFGSSAMIVGLLLSVFLRFWDTVYLAGV